MEQAIRDPSLVRLAQDLETLSVDELQMVLSDLPIIRVLDLLVLDSPGSKFREAIRRASMSSQLIRTISNEPDRFAHLWASLNQLACFRHGRKWLRVETGSNEMTSCYIPQDARASYLSYVWQKAKLHT
jgi:hypothetical protein